MRPSGIRRLFIVMLAAAFAWPLPAAGNEPSQTPRPTLAPSPPPSVSASPAPIVEPAPSAPAPSLPTPGGSQPPLPDGSEDSPPPADHRSSPAAPNQDALDAADPAGSSGFSTLSCIGAIIDNGFIQLGVNPEGHLNVPCGTASSETGTTYVGLRYRPDADNTEATAPGCLCEGWGAADATTGVTGYANVATDGVVNLQVVQFSSDADEARSIVEVGTTLRVTHDYRLSPTEKLYEVFVQIENLSAAPVDLRYRRVMDWDVEPTAFDEFVTVHKGTSDVLKYTNNDGFATANPLGSRVTGTVSPMAEDTFVDVGPTDQGALFDFEFGELPPGATKSFFTYYGAAADEIDALGAIGQVQAEAYSLGQPNTAGGPTQGTPNTFIFAFKGLTEVQSAPPGTDLNGHPNTGASDDPVHTFSGSFTHAESDLTIPGRGPAIALNRTYNSNDSRVGPLGPGWAHSYAMRLADAGDGSGDLVLVGPQGRSDRYTRNPDGTFSSPPAIHSSLVQEADGTYTATHKDRSAWRFDAGGRLFAIIDRHGNASALTYDASGNLTAIADPAGRGSLALAYTGDRLTSVTDWATPARTVMYGYDASGRLETVTDREGETTTYGYHGTTHWLTTITDANGHVAVTNTYDAAGRVIRQQDARGLVNGAETTFSYTDNPDGTRTTLVSYPPAAFEPAFAPTQEHLHSADGWLLTETRSASSTEGAATTFTYDADGNRSSVTDARGATTTFCYDVALDGTVIAGSAGNLTRRIDPAPTAGEGPLLTLIEYDAFDSVVRLVPPRGVAAGVAVTCASDLSAAVDADFATDLAYDASGAQLTAVTQRATDPDAGVVSSVTRFEYGDATNPGLVTRVIPPRGNTGPSPDYGFATSYTYGTSGSQAGMLLAVSDPLGNVTSFGYDAVGRRTSVLDANGNAAGADPAEHTTTYEYDAEDRPRFVRLPAPEPGGAPLVTEFRYDPVGKRTVHLDAAGQVIRYSFDARNDLVRVEHSPAAWTDPALTPAEVIATTYAYDDAFHLTRITRAAGNGAERVTDYRHDGAGRLRTETQYPAWPATTDPLVSTFAYDPNGNLAVRSDPLGQTTSFAYDALNRLIGVDYADPGTADVTYAYDANGNRTSMADGTGSTTYAYDQLDRLTTVTSPGSVTVGYRYDRDGNRATLVYPGGDALTYGYDAAGRVTSLTDWDSRVTDYAYRPDGSLAGVEHLNGTSTTYTYDHALRLAEVLHAGTGGAVLEQLTYTLDAVGNLAAISEGGPTGEPVTERVSESSQRGQGNGLSHEAYISADGRYVTFESEASDLVSGDTNAVADVFVHDRETDTTTRVSVASDGTQANGSSEDPTISPDGRWVAFRSAATNLVAGDTNSKYDIFLHDLQTGTTSRVSLASDGSQANGASDSAVVSRDGTAVVFRSFGRLVTGDTNGAPDIYVRDLVAGTTTRVSVASDGSQANGPSDGPTISDDGLVVAFDATASNLVPGDANAARDVFVHDRASATTSRLSVSAGGTEGNDASLEPTLDATGSVVGFTSSASNLVPGDTNAKDDAFVVTRATGAISRASLADDGSQGNGHADETSLSADGSRIAFFSASDNLVAGDSNGTGDVFVRDLVSGGTTRWSVASDGSQGDGRSTNPTLAGGGHTVAFHSFATNLVPGDTNNAADVFVRDAGGGSSVTAYTHDRLSRLTGADGPDGTRSYAYDPIGNRLEAVRDGTPTAYSYDAADRLTSVGGTAVSVDAAGNLVARGSDAFTYDAANRLVSASMGGVTQTSTYDGDGTRVATTVNSTTTTSYIHDLAAGLPLVIDDGARRYVWGPAGLAYAVETATGVIEIVHADHLGSVRTTTDATGSVTATARYDEFGVPLAATGASGSSFGFTGEPTDPTGLVHLRARSYDPELGRFLSRDPWPGSAQVPMTLNRYAYVGNNPVRLADPSGRNPCASFLAAYAGGPPGWAVGTGGALICAAIIFGVGLAVSGPDVAQNPPDIDISIDLSRSEHPEDFEHDRHLKVLRNLYQSGDLGLELKSGLWNPCRERGPRCDAARAVVVATVTAIVIAALEGQGDITQWPYSGPRPKDP